MRIAFITVAALFLLGTGTAAQEISIDYNKADFAHFQTYAWASGHSVDEPLNRSIVSSVRTLPRQLMPLEDSVS